jgi:hypothetical protein
MAKLVLVFIFFLAANILATELYFQVLTKLVPYRTKLKGKAAVWASFLALVSIQILTLSYCAQGIDAFYPTAPKLLIVVPSGATLIYLVVFRRKKVAELQPFYG